MAKNRRILFFAYVVLAAGLLGIFNLALATLMVQGYGLFDDSSGPVIASVFSFMVAGELTMLVILIQAKYWFFSQESNQETAEEELRRFYSTNIFMLSKDIGIGWNNDHFTLLNRQKGTRFSMRFSSDLLRVYRMKIDVHTIFIQLPGDTNYRPLRASHVDGYPY